MQPDRIGLISVGQAEEILQLAAGGIVDRPDEQKTVLMVVDLDSKGDPARLEVPASFPSVVVGISATTSGITAPGLDFSLGPEGATGSEWVGCSDPFATLESVAPRIGYCPRASVTFSQVLRNGTGLSVEQGLILESLAYSSLQAGPEFARWLAGRTRRAVAAPREPELLVFRVESREAIVINRSYRHNAYNANVRELLCDALSGALMDESITQVTLRGRGPSFCSGGDLDEFGTFADPVSAHLLRVARSPARLISTLGERCQARIHGWSVGSGIELPCFASQVTADPGTRIRLPELEMGLIPGAGGTVSLPRRAGRHRVAFLGLSGQVIDAATALEWGLVDRVEPVEPG